METLDLIAVGEVIKAQGIKGEVKVIPLTDSIKRFKEIRRVYWKNESGYYEMIIENARPFNQYILLKFAGINDMTAAKALGRGLIFIPRFERPKLPAGRYYHDQLLGLKVYTVSGRLLGSITEIIETGANDVYRVSGLSGEEVLIPALKSIVKKIDLEKTVMLIEPLPGLLEEQDRC